MPPSQELQQHPVTPQGSATPLVSSAQRQASQQSESESKVDGATDEKDPKTGKRRFLGLGKKKESKQPEKDMAVPTMGSMPPPQSTMRSTSPGKASADLKPHPQPIPISPSRTPYHQYTVAASPSRLRSSSPRMHSPASSEIFERSVQEPVQIGDLQGELSPAHIPSHVITEDHIPPALEASAQAITSEELNADQVEIVTSASHQPAGSAIEGSTSHADLTQLNTPLSPFSPLQQMRSEDSELAGSMHQSGILATGSDDDGASNYGQLDPNDVRRLSFISFADVVQSEHQQPPSSALGEPGDRNSLHVASLPSSFKQDRAASPLRSPRSPRSTHSHSMSGGVTTPPPGMNINPINAEQSPGRSAGVASPVSPHGELTVETMRQTIHHTTSGDLSGVRSAGMSPVSDENPSNAPLSRTNS